MKKRKIIIIAMLSQVAFIGINLDASICHTPSNAWTCDVDRPAVCASEPPTIPNPLCEFYMHAPCKPSENGLEKVARRDSAMIKICTKTNDPNDECIHFFESPCSWEVNYKCETYTKFVCDIHGNQYIYEGCRVTHLGAWEEVGQYLTALKP